MNATMEEAAGQPEGATQGVVRSVLRALEIMDLFVDGPNRPYSIAEVVTHTGLAKTTVIRLLHTLEVGGALGSSAHGYVLGPGLWRWGYAANRAWELPQAARDLMRGLAESAKETVNVYIRRGGYRICVAQEESPMPLRHVVHIGDQLPLVSGAASKVLLSQVDPAFVEKLFADAPPGAPSLEELLADIREVGSTGYSQSHGEREAGLSAVAVPLLSRAGEVVAALTFSGPSVRFPVDRVPHLAAELKEAARQLSEFGIDHPLRSR